jgi:S-adenosylmethionine synthetase
MTYEIPDHKLESIVKSASEATANRILTELGLRKSQISQREAFRRFGEGRIMRWRKEGKIVPIKTVGKIYYNVNDLERLESINEL